MPDDFLKHAAITSQVVLVGVGLVLLWRLFLSPSARAHPPGPRLPPWQVSLPDAGLFLFHGFSGGFAASLIAGALGRAFALGADALAIAATAGLHFGALIGLALHLHFHRPPPAPASAAVNPFRAGLLTFIIALPIVFAVNLGWLGLLKLLGVELARQPAVELVTRLGGTPWFYVFVVSAVLLAPAAEELLFRAGLFRIFLARAPRRFAYLAPALLFALIHFHLESFLPLAVLGVIFSFAYERTGSIATPIVAHAAFNLNNLLMVLAGTDQ